MSKGACVCPEDKECLCPREGVEFDAESEDEFDDEFGTEFGDDFETEFGEAFSEMFGEVFEAAFGEESELYTCKKPKTNWFTENGATMALVCGILAPVFFVASILSCVWFCCAIDRDETRVIMAVPAVKSNILRSEIA